MKNLNQPTNNRATNVLLMVGCGLLLLDIASRAGMPVSKAEQTGGIPDTGAQFQAMVDQLRTTNKNIESIDSLLESGKLTVQTHSLDKDTKDGQ